MKRRIGYKNLLMLVCAVFILNACSSKNSSQEYNKPALYWYNKMLEQISRSDLDAADDTYTSLESEHRNSPLIPSSILILVNAHMQEEEYALANFYLDEYIKRFGLSRDIDYVRYLKIKANFLGFKYEYRNQELIDDTIKQIAKFKRKYTTSPYMPLVDTMDTRLQMAKALFDKEISQLYKRIGKDKASSYYVEKSKKTWIDQQDIEEVDAPFYRTIFE